MNKYINFLKKISKKFPAILLIGLVLVSQVPTNVFAVSQASFSSSGMFLVGNHNQSGTQNWTNQLNNIVPGDQVAFKFTFVNTSANTAIDAKSKFSATANGNNITVTGTIWAQNAPEVSNSVTISAAPGYTISLSQMSASFGGVGDVFSGASNVKYYATGLYTITGQGTVQQPTVSISVAANGQQTNQVLKGNSVNVKWNSQNATQCVATSGSGFSTNNAINGTDVSSDLTDNATFSVSCTNASGASATAFANVNVFYSQVHWIGKTKTSCSATSYSDMPITDQQAVTFTSYITDATGTRTYPNSKLNDGDDKSWGKAPMTYGVSGSATTPSGYQYCGNSGAVTVDSLTTPQEKSVNLFFVADNIPQPTKDFTISVSPSTHSAHSGDSVQFTVSVNPINGFNSPVYLSLSLINPSSSPLFGFFSPQSITPGQTSTLTINIRSSATVGSYGAIIKGTDGSISRNKPIQVDVSNIVNPPQQPTASIRATINNQDVNQVLKGNEVRVNWSSTNAVRCEATSGAGFATNNTASGSDISDNLNDATTFTVKCYNASGASATASANVSVFYSQVHWIGKTKTSCSATSYSDMPTQDQQQVTFTSYITDATGTRTYPNSKLNDGDDRSWGKAPMTYGVSQNSVTAPSGYQYCGNSGTVNIQNSGSPEDKTVSLFFLKNIPTGNAPTVVTNSATNISQTTATLNGSVNPNSFNTTYWFEYGTSASLGSSTASQSLGSGNSSQNVSTYISGLSKSTKYYFRVVAQNQWGTSQGLILPFTTNGGVIIVVPPAKPTATLTSNKEIVSAGEVFSLSWTSVNATECHKLAGAQFDTGGLIGGIDNNVTLGVTTTYALVCTGLGGSVEVHKTVSLQGVTQDFTISATPLTSTTVEPGGNVTYRISVQPIGGFNQSVNLSMGTGDNVLSGTFSPSSITPGQTSNLTLNVSSSAQRGSTYHKNVNGQNGNIIRTADVYATVAQQQGNTPIVITNSATNLSQNSATLNGSVNPNGAATQYWFEYGTSVSLGASTASQSLGSGTSAQNVNSYISGLSANTTYYFRAVATNQYGSAQGSILSFTTQTGGGGGNTPIVITNSATNLSQNSATLNGSVNPNGAATQYWFEYGTSVSLGASTASQSLGSGTSAQNVNSYISGLSANTTYYFRAVATNQYGSAQG
ncbi:MAG: fibronectin type III domain-containing protein, partial [Candidatus Paceibacterota bacterium]